MSKKIKVLKIEPKEHPRACYIEATMKAFEKAVNAKAGDIEAKRLAKRVYAVFHKDRFLTDYEPNRRMGNDIISGTMYIVATNEKRFPISLTEEQISTYTFQFWGVEKFDELEVMETNMNTIFERLLKDEEL